MSIHDDVCRALTEYEDPKGCDVKEEDAVEGMYRVLIGIEDEIGKEVWEKFTSVLPKEPGRDTEAWYSGDEVVCKTEWLANKIADFFDALGYECVTGYYDPADDEREGCVDKFTGWYYMSI